METEEPLVALTLDDGPNATYTDVVLSILDSLDVQATFFVTGHELEQNIDQGRRIVAAGPARSSSCT
jgi:chitin deacetylase